MNKIILMNIIVCSDRKILIWWPEIQDLRRLIPKCCELKRKVNIRFMTNRYMFIRDTKLEDYVNLLSNTQFYITHNYWSYLIRTLKWDPMFNLVEERISIITWISFPSLPLIFFLEKKYYFS